MKKRRPLFLPVAALLFLAACGGAPAATNSSTTASGTTSQAATTSAETAVPAATSAATAAETTAATSVATAVATTASSGGAPGEAVTINFITIDDPDLLLAQKAVADAFAKSDPKYANVTINFQSVPFEQLFPKIESAVASGANIDMFLADAPDVKHYAFNKAIIPLQDYYTADELKQWLPGSVAEGSYKGVFYAPPSMESCSLMFYNKDMTDAAGLQPPAKVQGWTMEEALAAWKKTTVSKNGSGTPTQWGIRWGQGTYQGDYEHGIIRRSAGKKGSPTFMGVGADGVTFHGYLDTPEAIKSFQDYRSWHRGPTPVTPAEPINNIFFNKQSAFVVYPDNAIGTINRLYPNGDFHYGVTGIPYYADGSQLCHGGSWHFGVSPRTAHKDISVAIAKFFGGAEGSKIWYSKVHQLPARYDLLGSLPEYNKYPQQLFNEGLKTIEVPRIETPGYTEYQSIFGELMQSIVAEGDVDVPSLVKDAATKMEAALAKYKGWNQ
ncbi:MAG: extracellular solute-binding protein [Herpetosiphonaceae bacterium]|nr:extracellular solute-binding protein [Herpetosiphonaceae bacterium]